MGRLVVLDDDEAIQQLEPFNGDTVTELIAFMCQHGLQFAPPESGDEATYRKVFLAMREVFVTFETEQ